MKIKFKNKEIKIGTKREIQKFLFLPKIINNEFRWLEKAIYEQKFIQSDYGDAALGLVDRWVNTKWIN